MIKKCLICKKEFWVYPYRNKIAKYCSKKCLGKSKESLIGKKSPAWKGGSVSKICSICKKEYWVKLHRSKITKCCSKKCYYEFQKGKHYSPTTEFKKGQTAPNKGKKFPQFTRENANHWRGGRSKARGYILIYMPEHPFASKNGRIMEHRFIMEQWLRKNKPNHPALIEIDGIKYLRAKWIPHHRNEIRDDNRIKNFKLMTDFKHRSFHAKSR